MSIRIHELAKELGLKSPELVETIRQAKKAGALDEKVKESALAALDEDAVRKIRDWVRDAQSKPRSTASSRNAPSVAAPPMIKPPPLPKPTAADSPSLTSRPAPPKPSASKPPVPPSPATTRSAVAAVAPSGEVKAKPSTPSAPLASVEEKPSPAPTPSALPSPAVSVQVEAPLAASARPSSPLASSVSAPAVPPKPPASSTPASVVAEPVSSPSPVSTSSPASVPVKSSPAPISANLAVAPEPPVAVASESTSEPSTPPNAQATRMAAAPRPDLPAASGPSPAPAPAPPLSRSTPPPPPPSPTRSGGGPLSGHTGPHRGDAGGPRPPIQRSEPRPQGASPRIGSSSEPAPLRRPAPLVLPPPASASGAEGRRERDEGGRREGGRPLPSMAVPAPPIRREGPRSPQPEGKIVRPDRTFTPEQLRAMMQAGKLGEPGAALPRGGEPAPPRTDRNRPAASPPPSAARPVLTPRPSRGGTPNIPPLPFPPIPSAASALGLPTRRDPATTRKTSTSPGLVDDEEDRRKATAGGRLGSAADRASRRARRNERAADRRVTSPISAEVILKDDGSEELRNRGIRRHKSKSGRRDQIVARKSSAVVEPPVTLRSLSEATGIRASELMSKLFSKYSRMLTINDIIDDETAQLLALEFGVDLTIQRGKTAEEEFLEELKYESSEEDLQPRPPVITILGHVDHGKTSLLDKISGRNVVASESGGITQHIGAFQVEDHQGRKITFVDTPGHEAFTAMRERGAMVTDIAVLVVAADDGVMPQTIEAINHAKAAKVPIVVALNKCDLPNINIEKIYGELSQHELVPEAWGGEVPVVRTSALTGEGIPDLLETLGIVAELHELKADPKRPAMGTCLEASMSGDRGVVCNVLVQEGTLRVGAPVVCGQAYGNVRAMFDSKGRSLTEAPPSTPVAIYGLDTVPMAGERFLVTPSINKAREIAESRRAVSRDDVVFERPKIDLENLGDLMTRGQIESLNLILKADVQGSLEAITKELGKLENTEIPIRILHRGVGAVTESDVSLAVASKAMIVAFRVDREDRAVSLAESKGIAIQRYDVIYKVTDDIKDALERKFKADIKEVQLGRAAVLQVFKISKVGTVAGCMITKGIIERSARVRVLREGKQIYEGTIEALKRFKDDVREVREGFECGIKIANYDDLKVDDIIEAYRIEEVRRSIQDVQKTAS
ncbi:translation initiation factor IF-2 [Isosphaera pallida]|uniref:translation initiation factor IF-2 n=1 Tax=Isosphaera pallida TaxID=128 RepID=UPI0002D41247|nr:translation initiation factor IF-2 [Isosphaera pallida]